MSGTQSASLQQQSAARYAALGTTAGVLDIALAYDETRQSADMIWNGGDFALDRTPVTGMILALGCDARAAPGDMLPDDGAGWSVSGAPPLVDLRRGWAGDGLDAQGRRTGSTIWLYRRAKATHDTRIGVQATAASALGRVQATYGAPITLAVRWIAPGMLGLQASAGAATQRVLLGIG